MKMRTIIAAATMFLETDQELQIKLLTKRNALWKIPRKRSVQTLTWKDQQPCKADSAKMPLVANKITLFSSTYQLKTNDSLELEKLRKKACLKCAKHRRKFKRFSTRTMDSKSLGIKLKKIGKWILKYFCAKRGKNQEWKD